MLPFVGYNGTALPHESDVGERDTRTGGKETSDRAADPWSLISGSCDATAAGDRLTAGSSLPALLTLKIVSALMLMQMHENRI